MSSSCDQRVGIAKINALAVGNGFNAKWLAGGIARGGLHLKAYDVVIVVGVFVACGEIAEDAVLNFSSAGVYGNHFRDQQRRIVLQRDITVKVEYPLGWRGIRVGTQTRHCENQ